jgi:hypothetical protein
MDFSAKEYAEKFEFIGFRTLNKTITESESCDEVLHLIDELIHTSDIFGQVSHNEKNYDFMNEVIGKLDVNWFDEQIIVSILCFTCTSKDLLPNREKFYDDSEKRLLELIKDEKEVANALVGLK